MVPIRIIGLASGVFLVARTLIVAVTFAATLASSAVSVADPILLTPELNAEIVALLNSKDHSLPIVPVVVGQVDTRAQVETLIAPGQRPIIFQISNPSGPYFSKAKNWMFSEIALEYPNTVNFVKIPAGSEAAKALYPHDVTRPVYVTVDPAKGPSQVPMFIDEGEIAPDLSVNQVATEALIVKGLDIQPTLFATYPLTVENEHSLIYEF